MELCIPNDLPVSDPPGWNINSRIPGFDVYHIVFSYEECRFFSC